MRRSIFAYIIALSVAYLSLGNVYADSMIISHFDGAGSLILPEKDCWGCDHDMAYMHPHNDNQNKPSTVVFQWKKTEKCRYIDIISDIGEVVIKSKIWSKHLTQTYFKGDLPVSINANGTWNTVAITSTQPISHYGEKMAVYAYCRTGETPQEGWQTGYQHNSEGLSEDYLVGFDHDYYWTGNGSLISWVGEGTGKTRDWAVTFNAHKSLTVFQWYASQDCYSLTISDDDENTVLLDGTYNEVKYKLWDDDQKKWSDNQCNKLPCTFSVASDDYYIVKVKSEANAIPSGYLHAECSQ